MKAFSYPKLERYIQNEQVFLDGYLSSIETYTKNNSTTRFAANRYRILFDLYKDFL